LNHQDTKAPRNIETIDTQREMRIMDHHDTQGTRETKNQFVPVPAELDRIATAVVDAAYNVHKALGAGLLESVYEACLTHELVKRGFDVQTQLCLPVEYDGIKLDAGLRLDILVNGCVIIEVKAIEQLAEIHKAQLLTYLKLTGNRLGLLINFNVTTIKTGIRRIVL
jgi:GxxExxY protein